MTRTEIEKVARRILGEGTDLARLGDTAIMLHVIAKVMGSASTSASEAYIEEAFSRIAGSTVRRDEVRRDDPKLDDMPADPRTMSLEQLRDRATKARADAARASEIAYLGTPADAPSKPATAEQRQDGQGTAEAARRRMVQDAERIRETPEPRPAAKRDDAGGSEAARARMLADLKGAARRGE